ncbi:unnamed protein product [Rodentolepis nana]|uniref:IMS_C domain-containing protein n=1 Tax=Rodentolepis nana TaxID=102285 RepID=A0A0R3TI01_RODNA|nr:unnamed protein product [Rodentolepis nana]
MEGTSVKPGKTKRGPQERTAMLHLAHLSEMTDSVKPCMERVKFFGTSLLGILDEAALDWRVSLVNGESAVKVTRECAD